MNGQGSAFAQRADSLTVHNTTYLGGDPAGHPRWPHQVGTLPHRADPYQERELSQEVLRRLEADRTLILSGMRGSGTTQLAAEYARTVWRSGRIKLLVWIDVSTPAGVVAAYAQAAAELFGDPGTDERRAARRFLAWLEPKAGQEPLPWIVVLDDADLAALQRSGLLPPDSPHGRTLVTTEQRTGDRRALPVGMYTPRESLAYSVAVLAAHGRRDAEGELRALAGELGHCPLALEQAAAYLAENGLTAPDYLEALTRHDGRPGELLPGAMVAWTRSVAAADRQGPAGAVRRLLQLLCLLAPDGVPLAVLTTAAVVEHLSLPDAPASTDTVIAALRTLHRLSLVDYDATRPLRAVHVPRVLQHVLHSGLTPEDHRALVRHTADALDAVWPEQETAPLAAVLRAHAAALVAHADDCLWEFDLHPLLRRLGNGLRACGEYQAAVSHYSALLTRVRERGSHTSPALRTLYAELADTYHRAGQPGDAAAFQERVVAGLEVVLGRSHADTLAARVRLDLHLSGRRDLDDARAWWAQTAEAGDTHAMTCLGNLLNHRGDRTEARTWYTRAADGGNTEAMVDLGRLLEGEGDQEGARTWYTRAAEAGNTNGMVSLGILLKEEDDREGARTWHTRSAEAGDTYGMVSLGALLKEEGDREGARTWHTRGAEAGDTYGMVNLGALLKEEGDREGARTWHTRGAEAGNHHGMYRLGSLLEEDGDQEGANTWYARSAEAGNTYGMLRLGNVLEEEGDQEGARTWYTRSAEAANTYGMLRLGNVLEGEGDREGARTWYTRSAEAANTYGMLCLGYLLEGEGDREGARTWYTRAVEAGNPQAAEFLRDLDSGST